MTSIKVLVRPPELGSTRTAISVQRPRLVAATDRPHQEEEPTLAERVLQFLDQRSA